MAYSHNWRSRLPDYPADHKLGMRVPNGGSNCFKCEYLNDKTKHDCKEHHFIEWNGGTRIPAPIEAYCCDFFSA